MDRGRKRMARSSARAAASWITAAELSGVARGGERQGRDAAARGDKRAADPFSFCRNAADYGKICAYSGPETGDRHFRDGIADTPCALKRRRLAATLG